MAATLATFGSIFKYRDGYYVYFATTPDGERIYAGRILDEEQTADLIRMSRKYEKLPTHSMHGSLALCFVILDSDGFKNQAATFGGTGNLGSDSPIAFLETSVCDEDAAKLKKIILEDKAIPSALVKLVEALQ